MSKPANKTSGLAWGFLCLLLLILVTAIYACVIEPFSLVITRHDAQSAKWPYQNPLKIAVLADIHLAYPWMTASHLQDIVTKTNAQKPDIIFLLGDYHGHIIPSVPIDADEALSPLKSLSATCGTFAVLGNHDLHPKSDWPDALIRTKIPVLQNQAKAVTCNGQDFWVAGLQDMWWQHADIDVALRDVTNNKPVFMLMHNPDSFPDMPQRVTMSFAGHTHGGQIKIPFIGAIKEVVPSAYGLRYLQGAIHEDGKDMFVSSGLGMTSIPMRLMTPPEVAIITVSRKSEP